MDPKLSPQRFKVTFIQQKCRSGQDIWLDNLSQELTRQQFSYQIYWLNHLAQTLPFLFTATLPQAEIIHTVPVLGKFLRKKCRRLIVTAHTFHYDQEVFSYHNPAQAAYWQLIRRYEERAFKQADRIISVSAYTQSRLKSLFGLNSELIYPGVDTESFRPKQLKDSPDSHKLRLFFCGNLNHRKGFDLLLKLAGVLGKKAEIRLACGLNATRRIYPNTKGNLVFLGRLKRNSPELIREYQECDIFIATSRLEGLSIALLEAMACAKAVIALNAGGIGEAVDQNRGGYLIDNLDLKKMAKQILFLGQNQQLRAQMGAYNRQKAQTNFSLTRFSRDYLRLFDSLP